MTREDCISRKAAIDKMQDLEDEDIKDYGCSIPEGFDGKRAIKALKALPSIQPTTKENLVVEDAISRQQVLSDYADWFGYGYRDNTFYKRLKNMPSIQPKPKTDVIGKIRAEITTLQNRCYSLTKGTMCAFCKFECKYRAESEDKE